MGTRSSFKGPVGLELYSLRANFSKNVPLTLDYIRDLGFMEVEGDSYGYPAEEFVNMLRSRGMKLVGTFADYARLRDDAGGVAQRAKALGVKYVLCGWIPHDESAGFTEKDVREAAEIFNRAGEKLRPEGIRFAYHPHGFEFGRHGNGTMFDLLAAETKGEVVAFELDVFWVEHAGVDPVELLRKYGSRFELVHLKDLRKNAKHDESGKAPGADSVATGQGGTNWPVFLREAQRLGVRHYFIEDESENAARQIPQSLRYLESMRW